jgi:hypothetical protein
VTASSGGSKSSLRKNEPGHEIFSTTRDSRNFALKPELSRANLHQQMGSGEQAWQKAAACERQALAAKDSKLQAAFRKLRDSWIRIANNAQLSEDVQANAERLKNERPG